MKWNGYRALFARLKIDTRKPLQLSHRPRCTARALMSVKFDGLISIGIAAILQRDRRVDCATGTELGRRELKVMYGDGRIAEAIAEGIQRRARFIPVHGIAVVRNLAE